jgi:hypothetical protein
MQSIIFALSLNFLCIFFLFFLQAIGMFKQLIHRVQYRRSSSRISPAIIRQKLLEGLDGDADVHVQDTSGGCGDFFSIQVASKKFQGLSIVWTQNFLIFDSRLIN